MKEEMLNLESLTEEERARIMEVLQRNEELQSAQDNRVAEIKAEINAIRMKAVLRQGEDGTKICSRCREPFGYFFNTGEICSQCKCKVCKNCREYTLKGAWTCILCYKQRQLKALTGEWLIPTPKEEETPDNLSVPDMVRKSIQHNSSNDEDAEDNVANTRSIYTEDLDSSSDGSGKNSVIYPRDTDKKRLSTLLSAKGLQEQEEEEQEQPLQTDNNNKLVQKVSTQRYQDSDSDSCSSDNEDMIVSTQTSAVLHSSLRSSTSALSTAMTSDTEDGSYHADGNGTSVSGSRLGSDDNSTHFDDSSYRAHSELPDIDDLIAKSKAGSHHSPLSSMTSSPTPSTMGQRLLDLATSAENSDAEDLQDLDDDFREDDVEDDNNEEGFQEEYFSEENLTDEEGSLEKEPIYVIEYTEPDDVSDALSVISETTEPSQGDDSDVEFENIYKHAKAEESIIGDPASSDTELDSIIEEMNNSSSRNVSKTDSYSEAPESAEGVHSVAEESDHGSDIPDSGAMDMVGSESESGSTVVGAEIAGDEPGRMEEFSDEDQIPEPVLEPRMIETPDLIQEVYRENPIYTEDNLDQELTVQSENTIVPSAMLETPKEEASVEAARAPLVHLDSFIDEMSYFCAPATSQAFSSREVSPEPDDEDAVKPEAKKVERNSKTKRNGFRRQKALRNAGSASSVSDDQLTIDEEKNNIVMSVNGHSLKRSVPSPDKFPIQAITEIIQEDVLQVNQAPQVENNPAGNISTDVSHLTEDLNQSQQTKKDYSKKEGRTSSNELAELSVEEEKLIQRLLSDLDVDLDNLADEVAVGASVDDGSQHSTDLADERHAERKVTDEIHITENPPEERLDSSDLVGKTKRFATETPDHSNIAEETPDSTNVIVETSNSRNIQEKTPVSTNIAEETPGSTNVIEETSNSRNIQEETPVSTNIVEETSDSTNALKETLDSANTAEQTFDSAKMTEAIQNEYSKPADEKKPTDFEKLEQDLGDLEGATLTADDSAITAALTQDSKQTAAVQQSLENGGINGGTDNNPDMLPDKERSDGSLALNVSTVSSEEELRPVVEDQVNLQKTDEDLHVEAEAYVQPVQTKIPETDPHNNDEQQASQNLGVEGVISSSDEAIKPQEDMLVSSDLKTSVIAKDLETPTSKKDDAVYVETNVTEGALPVVLQDSESDIQASAGVESVKVSVEVCSEIKESEGVSSQGETLPSTGQEVFSVPKPNQDKAPGQEVKTVNSPGQDLGTPTSKTEVAAYVETKVTEDAVPVVLRDSEPDIQASTGIESLNVEVKSEIKEPEAIASQGETLASTGQEVISLPEPNEDEASEALVAKLEDSVFASPQTLSKEISVENIIGDQQLNLAEVKPTENSKVEYSPVLETSKDVLKADKHMPSDDTSHILVTESIGKVEDKVSGGNGISDSVTKDASQSVSNELQVVTPQKKPRSPKIKKAKHALKVTFKEEIPSEAQTSPQPRPRRVKKSIKDANDNISENNVSVLASKVGEGFGAKPLSVVVEDDQDIASSSSIKTRTSNDNGPSKPPRKSSKKPRKKVDVEVILAKFVPPEDVLTPETLVRKKSLLKTTSWGESLLGKSAETVGNADETVDSKINVTDNKTFSPLKSSAESTAKSGQTMNTPDFEGGVPECRPSYTAKHSPVKRMPLALNIQPNLAPPLHSPNDAEAWSPMIDTPTLDALSEKFQASVFSGQFYHLSYGLDSPSGLASSPPSSETVPSAQAGSRVSITSETSLCTQAGSGVRTDPQHPQLASMPSTGPPSPVTSECLPSPRTESCSVGLAFPDLIDDIGPLDLSLQTSERLLTSEFTAYSSSDSDLADHNGHSDLSLVPSDHTDVSSAQEDSGNLTATSHDSSSLPSHSKSPSDASIPSIKVSAVDGPDGDMEDDVIDDLAPQPRTPSTFHQTFGSLFSSFGGSRESIASYYSQAGGGTYGVVQVKGTIQFAVDYKHKIGTLEIIVKQCSEVAAVDEKKQRSDPYVKTYLLPDRTRTGKRKTQIKKNSLDPVFNETLRYHLTKSELSNRTLWLTVWHHDRFGHNVFLGEVTVPLTYFNFSSTPEWHNLMDREEMEPSMVTYKGDLVVSLKYVPLENLKETTDQKKKKPKEGQLCVLIKEAKNLTAIRANGYSDSFCKGYLLPEKGKSLKQKTTVVKKNLSPKWNFLFTFEDISFEELPDRCLELTVWDHDRFSSNDFLGGVRLNIGTGTCKGKEVDWMDARGEEISIWQSMIDRPNAWVEGTLTLRASMDKVE